MEKFLIVANWKANKTPAEAKQWLAGESQYEKLLQDNLNRLEIAVAAPYTLLSQLLMVGDHWSITLSAQDVSAYPTGSYTGEVPAKLLSDLGVKYCLVGHSERRKYLHETNSQVEAKISQAIQNGIIPILCAQSLEEIPTNIRNFSATYAIMYEPFSAISTEGQYHPESVDKVVATLTDWKNKLGLSCQLLYGGSVNPQDVDQYVKPETKNLISGLVVGHASLEVGSFFAIIKKCLQVLS